MITPFEVYLVLQADHFKGAMILLAAVASIATGLSLIAWAEAGDSDRMKKAAPRVLKIAAPIAIVFFIAATFMPSARTLAAMIVLPALTSDKVVDAVTPEAKELYSLAKEALKRAATP